MMVVYLGDNCTDFFLFGEVNCRFYSRIFHFTATQYATIN